MASGAGHAKSHTAEVQATAKDQVLKMEGRGRSAEKMQLRITRGSPAQAFDSRGVASIASGVYFAPCRKKAARRASPSRTAYVL
jgi:hypothetical protein